MARLQSLRDLDAATSTLAEVCAMLLDTALADGDVQTKVFDRFTRDALQKVLNEAYALVRPQDDVYYRELNEAHRRVRLFLPRLLETITFAAGPAGESGRTDCGRIATFGAIRSISKQPTVAASCRSMDALIVRNRNVHCILPSASEAICADRE